MLGSGAFIGGGWLLYNLFLGLTQITMIDFLNPLFYRSQLILWPWIIETPLTFLQE